jgi:uncharacterized protein (DUF2141 family)
LTSGLLIASAATIGLKIEIFSKDWRAVLMNWLKSAISRITSVVLITSAAFLSVVLSPATNSYAQNKEGIEVRVEGMRSDAGRLACSLFNGPNGFPREVSKRFRGEYAPKKGGVGICEFNNVPAGTYAATVLDDTNSNGKMDFSPLGMPKKGYGFSNNAKATVLPPSPPSFKAASFSYSGSGVLTVPINIVNPKF